MNNLYTQVIWAGKIDDSWYRLIILGSMTFVEEVPEYCDPYNIHCPCAKAHARRIDDPNICALVYQMAVMQAHNDIRSYKFKNIQLAIGAIFLGAIILFFSWRYF